MVLGHVLHQGLQLLLGPAGQGLLGGVPILRGKPRDAAGLAGTLGGLAHERRGPRSPQGLVQHAPVLRHLARGLGVLAQLAEQKLAKLPAHAVAVAKVHALVPEDPREDALGGLHVLGEARARTQHQRRVRRVVLPGLPDLQAALGVPAARGLVHVGVQHEKVKGVALLAAARAQHLLGLLRAQAGGHGLVGPEVGVQALLPEHGKRKVGDPGLVLLRGTLEAGQPRALDAPAALAQNQGTHRLAVRVAPGGPLANVAGRKRAVGVQPGHAHGDRGALPVVDVLVRGGPLGLLAAVAAVAVHHLGVRGAKLARRRRQSVQGSLHRGPHLGRHGQRGPGAQRNRRVRVRDLLGLLLGVGALGPLGPLGGFFGRLGRLGRLLGLRRLGHHDALLGRAGDPRAERLRGALLRRVGRARGLGIGQRGLGDRADLRELRDAPGRPLGHLRAHGIGARREHAALLLGRRAGSKLLQHAQRLRKLRASLRHLGAKGLGRQRRASLGNRGRQRRGLLGSLLQRKLPARRGGRQRQRAGLRGVLGRHDGKLRLQSPQIEHVGPGQGRPGAEGREPRVERRAVGHQRRALGRRRQAENLRLRGDRGGLDELFVFETHRRAGTRRRGNLRGRREGRGRSLIGGNLGNLDVDIGGNLGNLDVDIGGTLGEHVDVDLGGNLGEHVDVGLGTRHAQSEQPGHPRLQNLLQGGQLGSGKAGRLQVRLQRQTLRPRALGNAPRNMLSVRQGKGTQPRHDARGQRRRNLGRKRVSGERGGVDQVGERVGEGLGNGNEGVVQALHALRQARSKSIAGKGGRRQASRALKRGRRTRNLGHLFFLFLG